jgi:hypothetical protein
VQTTLKGISVAEGGFVRRLGEAGYGRDDARVRALDVLARAGLPVPDGVVLTRRAHEEFLLTNGIVQDIRAARGGEDARGRAAGIRHEHASKPVEGELNWAICEALIGLHAEAVVTMSEDLEKGSLRTIPEVRDAVRDAWLSLRGLERQVEAVGRGEPLPTWPVLIQRELRPLYTGWSTAAGEAGRRGGPAAGRSAGSDIALYDVEPAGEVGAERGSIAGFTLEAGSVLGRP